MTGPSEESAPGHPEPTESAQPSEMFSEDRTDSAPHPAASGFEAEPTQVVQPQYPQQGQYPQQQPAPPLPQPSQGQQYQQPYDQNLPPLHPQPQQAAQYPPPQQQQQQYAPPPQQQAVPGLPQPQGRHALPDELATASLVKPQKRKPQSGWRKALYVGTGKLVNPGESPKDTRKRELIAQINQPLRGCYKIAMLSLKGGVGKTTTTTTLGSTFASLRGDRVVAVDANPDRGTLSQKIPIETTATVRHLLRDADKITRYSDVRSYTSQGGSRLEILASEQDPAVSEAFSEDDYRRTVNLLEHFYNIVLTDCGTGLMHSAMKGVLDVADALVVVSSGSVDGARSASATLDWLEAHGYGDLVKRSVAVINSVRPKGGSVDLDKLSAHFGARVRSVCRIPFDPHLEEGAEIELDRLGEDTRLALLELAATVADGFGGQQYQPIQP
ncbi:MinD/ParA family ATP-binding protein [Amycolatopsis keratiniphila]|uniref:MinD/ParA family ATP-binding protein n=1 Tax=Amycolatopsis keratiniphila TaxID=129921 RepID=UPI00087B4C96|nr:MinD/ParA family protein [Amycolatopsis keratiniphila]OLZ56197.1 ATPase [Amycolatopsis keratiniphila subsp. nogabecina]SDU52443.1 MinD-like ATPase involved in chromosome partitioning or flagellar assembly [Amycolatopsis keratiniphila]